MLPKDETDAGDSPQSTGKYLSTPQNCQLISMSDKRDVFSGKFWDRKATLKNATTVRFQIYNYSSHSPIFVCEPNADDLSSLNSVI
jgi:hypothetical protein